MRKGQEPTFKALKKIRKREPFEWLGVDSDNLGFDVRDIDEKIALCKKMGIPIIQSGQGSTSRFAYLDTVKVGGVIFELIQRRSRRVCNQ